MTKTAAYFPLQCAQNSTPVMTAVVESLQRAGYSMQLNSKNADIAVIWSVLWAGRMAANREIYYHYRNSGRPVVCIEVGTLFRNTTWKIAVNHINAMGYFGHQQNLDWDRPKKFGLRLRTSTQNHGRILVAGQHKKSLQLEGVDQESWYVEKIKAVAQDRQVVVRPHPRCALDRRCFPEDVVWQTPAKIDNTYDSFDIDWNYDAVINYNSGPGIQAVIQGVPVVVDSTSLAYGITDRERWLTEICHTEYTVEEIRQGIWVKRTGLEH